MKIWKFLKIENVKNSENQKNYENLEDFEYLKISVRGLTRFAMQSRAGPKFENSYEKLNVPREQQEQHSNPSHEHAAKAAGKNFFFENFDFFENFEFLESSLNFEFFESSIDICRC